LFGCISPVDSQLKQVVTVEKQQRFSRLDFGVSLAKGVETEITNFCCPTPLTVKGEPFVKILPPQVRYGVAEAVNVDDLGLYVSLVSLRPQGRQLDKFVNAQFPPKLINGNSFSDVSGDGRKNVAPMKSSADDGQKVVAILQLNDLNDFAFAYRPPEQTVIGTDEKVFFGLDGNSPATRPDAWVDDSAKHCAFREEPKCAPQCQSPRRDILRRNFVG
jgi:hypothetical protein